jgi:hypothetical protein
VDGARFRYLGFGAVEIDGQVYEHDVVVEGGYVRRRKKGPSKPRRAEYGHTPLTPDEVIPWSAPSLVVGTGASGQLPISEDLYQAAADRGVTIIARPTAEACALLAEAEIGSVAAVLHVTC